jgi:hypothetical protein
MNQFLYFIHREHSEYFDVLEQNNKWSIITVENSLKVTNYLNTQKHQMLLFVIITYGNNGVFLLIG